MYGMQGRNDGGAKGAQFPGRWITTGVPHHCAGGKKSQQCHMCVLQYSTLLSKDLRFEHRGTNQLLAPGAI